MPRCHSRDFLSRARITRIRSQLFSPFLTFPTVHFCLSSTLLSSSNIYKHKQRNKMPTAQRFVRLGNLGSLKSLALLCCHNVRFADDLNLISSSSFVLIHTHSVLLSQSSSLHPDLLLRHKRKRGLRLNQNPKVKTSPSSIRAKASK